MSDTILVALKNAAVRVGVTISDDAAKALARLYEDTGRGTQEVVRRFETVERANLERIDSIAGDLGRNQMTAFDVFGTGTPLRTAARSRISRLLEPAGADRTVSDYIDRLRRTGHAVQRHLEVDDQGLQERLGEPILNPDGTPQLDSNGHVRSRNYVDPETGRTDEKTSNGGIKPHRCGEYSTRFDSPDDMVKVHRYVQATIAATGKPPRKIDISIVLGPHGHERMTGFYRDPTDPHKFLPVNFQDGKIIMAYAKNTQGDLRTVTMFPTPPGGRHP